MCIMPLKKIAIAIVDDHTPFRSNLVKLIERFEEVSIIFEAINGYDFLEKLSKNVAIDVVLMDINMPIMDGYKTTKWIKANYPSIKVLALSMFEDDNVIIEMVKAGAGGYLLKGSKPSDLLVAIQTIHKNGFYFNDFVSDKLISTLQKNTFKAIYTEKELIFLQLCSTELTYREIAVQMNVSHRTVDNYRESLFIKFNIRSRTGLVVCGIKSGLIKI